MSPHWRFSRLLTDVEVVKAKTGQSGRHRESREAMWPVFVKTKTASAPKPLAILAVELQISSDILSEKEDETP